jgi:hypothetical protein
MNDGASNNTIRSSRQEKGSVLFKEKSCYLQGRAEEN